MLVITRRGNRGESVMISKDGVALAEITFVEIRQNQARISIKAPKDVNIMRNELLDHKTLEKYRSQL